jgi:hypothetical protein
MHLNGQFPSSDKPDDKQKEKKGQWTAKYESQKARIIQHRV